MAPRLKQDYPALIAEYERRIAAGESLQEVKSDFTARGINFGTFDNQRRAFKKKTPQEPTMIDEPVAVLPGQMAIEDADTPPEDAVSAVADIAAVSEISEPLSLAETQTLEHYEAIITQGFKTFVEVGQSLLAIREQRLYRQGYATFEEYLQQRWDLGQSRAYQLMDAADVVTNLQSSTIVELPRNEAQARPLTTLSPEQQVDVWQEAVQTAPAGKVTAKHVQNTVKRLKPGTTTPTVAKPKVPEPETRPAARMRLQNGLFAVLSMVRDGDAWKILEELALVLDTYAEQQSDADVTQHMEQALSPLWHLIEDHQQTNGTSHTSAALDSPEEKGD